MKIQVLQHFPFGGPGYIEQWALNNGHSIERTRLFKAEVFPSVSETDFLVVLGGPMGINDEEEYNWLVDEKRYICNYLASGKPVIGICLGSQLIADVLGGDVYPARQMEIGWFPVSKTKEGSDSELIKDWAKTETVLHWHGDTYDLPDGATNLMTSEVCENQMFVYRKNVVGIQYHLEMTRDGIEENLDNTRDGLGKCPTVQTEEEIRSEISRAGELHNNLKNLLNQLSNKIH